MSVHVTGDIQTINSLTKLANNLEKEAIIPEIDSWQNDIYEGFISKMHVWEGTMKQRTGKILEDTVGTSKRKVIVDVPYAERENSRQGDKGRGKGTGHGTPHRFVEPTLDEQNPKHVDALINKIARFINSN